MNFTKLKDQPLLVQIIAGVILAILVGYFSTVRDAIPRSEAQSLIKQSEDREEKSIDKLEIKQDKMLDKLSDMKEKLDKIGEKVGVSK